MDNWCNLLRFYLKKSKILSVSIKDKSCNSPEDLQLQVLVSENN